MKMKNQFLPFTLLIAVLGCLSSNTWAFDAFGFKSDMTKKAVEQYVDTMKLGVSSWMGATLIVESSDRMQQYMLNFCDDKLYSVSQSFATNFEQMANFVDTTISQHGQPIFVSATGGMGMRGFVRPINLYWKIGKTDYLRLMQLKDQYSLIYETENTCTKVPN